MRPSSFRDSGIIATPASRLRLGLRASCCAARQDGLPFLRRRRAEDRPRELGAPGAHEAGQPEDLARAQLEAHVPRRRARSRSRTESATGASAGGGAFGGNVAVSGRPEHRLDQRRLGLGRRRRRLHQPAVPKNRDGVGELEHLLEEVRDEDDRRARGRERAHDLVEMARLARVERRGRLVHDDQLSVTRERTEDLDLLLLRRPQLLGRHVSAQVEACPLDELRHSAASAPASGRSRPRRGSAPSRTFSATVSCGTTFGSWAIAATPAARAPRAATRTRPAPLRAERGRRPAISAPATILPSVDLPAPFSPTSAWTEPRRTPSETESSAWTPPKCLETSRSSR